MARINIEDSLFREDGFLNLIEKTGNRYTALGMVVSAFTLAQKHWIKHKAIPLSEWPESLNLLIETKLVVQKDDMIYVKGSKEAFMWLERNSNAGKVLSEKKLDQLKKARIKKAESLNLDRTTTEPALNLSEDLTLTLTPTLTPTQDLTQNSNSNSFNTSEVVKNHLPVKVSKAAQNGCIKELELHEISTALFNTVNKNTQKTWLAAYPNAQWICHEALKAEIWMNENPQKRPKNFGRFFSNWLSRAFEQYRKGIPSNVKSKEQVKQDHNERAKRELFGENYE